CALAAIDGRAWSDGSQQRSWTNPVMCELSRPFMTGTYLPDRSVVLVLRGFKVRRNVLFRIGDQLGEGIRQQRCALVILDKRRSGNPVIFEVLGHGFPIWRLEAG